MLWYREPSPFFTGMLTLEKNVTCFAKAKIKICNQPLNTLNTGGTRARGWEVCNATDDGWPEFWIGPKISVKSLQCVWVSQSAEQECFHRSTQVHANATGLGFPSRPCYPPPSQDRRALHLCLFRSLLMLFKLFVLLNKLTFYLSGLSSKSSHLI